jgi:recombination endonuclease VII
MRRSNPDLITVSNRSPVSHIPRPVARIPDVRFPAVPFCWRWLPPVPADWERAKVNRWGPVTDPQLIAFGVLVGWCRYRCSICGISDPDYRLVMDHDHRTGLCRGLLCIDCNRTEGFAAGGVWALYRARPPALICGTEVYYWPASVLPAAPELLEFAEDLSHSKWIRRTWAMRTRQRWFASEDRIASRDDLDDAEVASILARTEGAVAARHRSLKIGPPDIDSWP